ncbi:MAG: 2-amino-4-hydroxy-6-hydroxymethyldihydropteridine diphosphokinase [Bacteroidaceae bacterium]|nr:2-amino-4-hydroxy-6-hydroxymethyldihydropteridine diphosphokinase [Bacteroidaceae bacterium]
MHLTILSLGTNLGNRKKNIQDAIRLISQQVGPLQAQSSLIETEPWGFSSPNKFLNAVISVETHLSPHALLRKLQSIERQLGRTKKTPTAPAGEQPPYEDRIIDIDILLYYKDKLTATPQFDLKDWGGSIQISTPTLCIPHPHMHERDFVLNPLKEIL